MATTNFAKQMAQSYYVFTPQDEWEYDMLKSELTDIACEQGFERIDTKWGQEYLTQMERHAQLSHHDYYGVALPCYKRHEFYDPEGNLWYAEIVPILRSGYYEGCNLDFTMKLYDSSNEYYDRDCTCIDTLQEIINDTLDFYYDDDYRRMSKLSREEMEKVLAEQVVRMVKACKDDFEKFAKASGADEYLLGGVFSNGEGIYLNKTELEKRTLKSA